MAAPTTPSPTRSTGGGGRVEPVLPERAPTLQDKVIAGVDATLAELGAAAEAGSLPPPEQVGKAVQKARTLLALATRAQWAWQEAADTRAKDARALGAAVDGDQVPEQEGIKSPASRVSTESATESDAERAAPEQRACGRSMQAVEPQLHDATKRGATETPAGGIKSPDVPPGVFFPPAMADLSAATGRPKRQRLASPTKAPPSHPGPRPAGRGARALERAEFSYVRGANGLTSICRRFNEGKCVGSCPGRYAHKCRWCLGDHPLWSLEGPRRQGRQAACTSWRRWTRARAPTEEEVSGPAAKSMASGRAGP